MATKESYLFFCFIRLSPSGKTKIIGVYTKDKQTTLGKIKWQPGWRKYCFFPSPETLFDADCLLEITNYLYDLMNERLSIPETKP